MKMLSVFVFLINNFQTPPGHSRKGKFRELPGFRGILNYPMNDYVLK